VGCVGVGCRGGGAGKHRRRSATICAVQLMNVMMIFSFKPISLLHILNPGIIIINYV